MNIRKTVRSIAAATLIFCATTANAGDTVTASGDASEDMAAAAIHLVSATGNLSAASLYLSEDVSIAVGRAVTETVLTGAEISGDAVVFSSAVLADGLMTTAQLSGDLTLAGVHFSADTAQFIADAAHAGIHLSVDTAELFLDQAVNVAVTSGKLSGKAAELAAELSAAGVEFSADSTILVARAGKKGVRLSEEAAERFIADSLAIADTCMESALITERYIVMTAAEANRILHETSMATVQSALENGRKVYLFTDRTAAHLKGLGIDAQKYAVELSRRAANSTAAVVNTTIDKADDAVVVVINTGSSLIIASIDSLTAAVENTTENITK